MGTMVCTLRLINDIYHYICQCDDSIYTLHILKQTPPPFLKKKKEIKLNVYINKE